MTRSGAAALSSVLALLGVLIANAVSAAPKQGAQEASDLSGLWTSTSLTALERPKELTGLTVSDADAAAYEKVRPGQLASDSDGVGGREAEADQWDFGKTLARIDGRARTSWIVSPEDGRLPYSAAGKAALAKASAAMRRYDDPETRPSSERCLLPGWGAAGPPMLNAPYSNVYQIVQTPQTVAIAMENNHEVRLISTSGAGRLPAAIRPWMGDSVGRWDGATLVVETSGFTPGDALRPPIGLYISPDAKVTERFTRISAGELRYDFTVDDPSVYTQPWRGEMVFTKTRGPMLEYACHEGNYSLPGILSGARQQEKAAAGAR